MDTLKIKAVLLAVKYKSLSRAAEEFSYTPSALSHSVDSLEHELGVKLLNRSHAGVELSAAGERLLEKLSAVVEAEDELIRCASAMATSQHERLRIGTYSSVSVNLLPKILNGFKEQYPEIRISITVGNRINDWLEKDVVDVLFGTESAAYEWLPVVRDDFVAVVPETMFPGRKTLRCEELYPYPFILTENLDTACGLELNGFKELIRLTSEDDMSAVSMVQEGMGVTILPSLVFKQRQRGIRTIRLKPELYRTLGVSYTTDRHPLSGAMKFVQYLKTVV